MNLEEKIQVAHSKAASLYLRRQLIELSLQQLQAEKIKVGHDMLKSDGEIETLEALRIEMSPKNLAMVTKNG